MMFGAGATRSLAAAPSTRFAVAFAAFAAILALTSYPRAVGDAHEYVGMSLSIIAFGSPSPAPAQLGELQRRLADHGLPLVRDALHEGRDGRLHHRHFWLYSALATPLVAAAGLAGLHPVWGFTALNVLLLALAAGLVAARTGAAPAALLFAGPIVWWIDKAHPEAFVFAAVAAGMALFAHNTGAALIVWSLAAAQYPPLALLPAAGVIAALTAWPRRRRDVRFLAAVAVAFTLAALHPIHSWWKLGVATPFAFWGREATWPSLRAWAAVYADLNIGLLVNFPFVLVAAVLLVLLPRSARRALYHEPALWIAGVAAIVLPGAFAQTVNVNHGGTPGMSRYALWLLALSVPLWAAIGGADDRERGMTAARNGPDSRRRRPASERSPTAGSRASAAATLTQRPALAAGSRTSATATLTQRPVLAAMAGLSVLWCLVWFHPRRAESYQEPTRLAAAVWRYAPRLSAPLPEVFAERIGHAEPGLLPAATPSCSKVLLLDGRWPAPCAPSATTPERCRAGNALCYADRRPTRPGGYRFRLVEEPLPAAWVVNRAVWPRAAEERAAVLLNELGWWEMAGPEAARDQVLRAADNAGWTTWMIGDGRFFLYASAPHEGARVTLRLPEPMRGAVLAARNGAVLTEITSPQESGALWALPLPAVGEPGVFVALRAARRAR